MPVNNVTRIKRITDSIISLPTLPAVISKMLDLVDNPKTTASSLASLIMQDQVLTARILKIANSSFYGFPRGIATVKLAIVVLGFDNVKEMGLSLSVLNSFKSEPGNKYFDTSQFWQHSIAVGAGARMLARDTCRRLAGEAFVAGLLHDIGKIILNQYMPAEFAQVQTLVFEHGAPLEEAEQKILGVGHPEVGAWLAERWNLPVNLVDAIKYHEHPETAEKEPELSMLVYLANHLAAKCGLGKSGSPGNAEIPQEAMELATSLLGVSGEQLEAYRDELIEEYHKAAGIFSEVL